jgi:hypothetical protein
MNASEVQRIKESFLERAFTVVSVPVAHGSLLKKVLDFSTSLISVLVSSKSLIATNPSNSERTPNGSPYGSTKPNMFRREDFYLRSMCVANRDRSLDYLW